MINRIYLDTSVYNRPFDDQTQPRIWLETLAFSIILQMITDQTLQLITSSVVTYENSRNPYPLKQDWINETTQLALENQTLNPNIRQRAKELEQINLKALDALHVACAEAAKADYFVTVDDKLIRRYRDLDHQQQYLIICDPTQFVRSTGVKT